MIMFWFKKGSSDESGLDALKSQWVAIVIIQVKDGEGISQETVRMLQVTHTQHMEFVDLISIVNEEEEINKWQ